MNLRTPYEVTGLANPRIRPLCHLSSRFRGDYTIFPPINKWGVISRDISHLWCYVAVKTVTFVRSPPGLILFSSAFYVKELILLVAVCALFGRKNQQRILQKGNSQYAISEAYTTKIFVFKKPKYRFFWKQGKRIFLPGAYNSSISLLAYHRAMIENRLEFEKFIAEVTEVKMQKSIAANTIAQVQPVKQVSEITIQELYDKRIEFIKTNFKKEKVRDAVYCCKKSCTPLLEKHGDWSVSDFGRKELIAIQDSFVSSGLGITTCNNYLTNIRTLFNWGAEKAHIDDSIADSLKKVKKLQEGRTIAPPPTIREGVPFEVIEATKKYLPQMISDMVDIQLECAMRPAEIWTMKWRDIDTSDDIWVYEPKEYKERLHVEYKVITLTPLCQKILSTRYADTPPDEIIFSRKRNAVELGQNNLKRYKNDKFNKDTYRAYIKEAAEKAGVPHWYPYQLRHWVPLTMMYLWSSCIVTRILLLQLQHPKPVSQNPMSYLYS